MAVPTNTPRGSYGPKGDTPPVIPWLGVAAAPPTIPKLYWDAYSDEQRIKTLWACFNGLANRVNQLGYYYLPDFQGEWDRTKEYPPLSVVSAPEGIEGVTAGNSYTALDWVPVGTPLTDTTYWALTGNYNAQIAAAQEAISEISPFDNAPTQGSTKGVTSNGIYNAIEPLVMKFDTFDDMISSSSNWEVAIVTDGSTYEYGYDNSPIYFKNVDSTYSDFNCDLYPELSNGHKAVPITPFKYPTCEFEGALESISEMVLNTEYRYQSNSGAFLDTAVNSAGNKVGQCSSLVYAYLLNLNPNNSRWVLGNSANNRINQNGFMFPHTEDSSRNNYLSANRQAYFASVNGLGFVPTSIYDLKSGDVVFFSNATQEGSFLNITHCAIVTSVDIDGNNYNVIEWGAGNDPVTSSVVTGSDGIRITSYEFTGKVVYAARMPMKTSCDFYSLGKYNINKTYTTEQDGAFYRARFFSFNSVFQKDRVYKIKVSTSVSAVPFRIIGIAQSSLPQSSFLVSNTTLGGEIEFYAFAPSGLTNVCQFYIYTNSEATVKINSIEILQSGDSQFYTSSNSPIIEAISGGTVNNHREYVNNGYLDGTYNITLPSSIAANTEGELCTVNIANAGALVSRIPIDSFLANGVLNAYTKSATTSENVIYGKADLTFTTFYINLHIFITAVGGYIF